VRNQLELKFSKDKLQNLNTELNDYKNELEKVLESKDKFFSIISHDLRSPLGGFLGLTQMLSESLDELEKDEVKTISTSLYKAAKNINNLLENLLDWSKSQTGMMKFEPRMVKLRELFDRVLRNFNIQVKDKKIQINNSISEELNVFADPDMLMTVLRNLIGNALKFSHENGKIDLLCNHDKNFCFITVKDYGVGIPDDTRRKLFRLDTKMSTRGTKNETGSGLGLILSKELIEKNGGRINVNSIEGEGTEFIFTLPTNETVISSS
jgi:signal transduction histidine kinase